MSYFIYSRVHTGSLQICSTSDQKYIHGLMSYSINLRGVRQVVGEKLTIQLMEESKDDVARKLETTLPSP